MVYFPYKSASYAVHLTGRRPYHEKKELMITVNLKIWQCYTKNPDENMKPKPSPSPSRTVTFVVAIVVIIVTILSMQYHGSVLNTFVFRSYMFSCCTSLAIPKSVTLHVSPSPTNTLRAARSRWMICKKMRFDWLKGLGLPRYHPFPSFLHPPPLKKGGRNRIRH